ncbi:site-specific integrase [Pseudomonadota bacterium AL_CKDN230030165-1A_HGKHYDSX7]
MLREGASENTASAYRGAIQYWAAWHSLRIGTPLALPVAAAVVLRFVADHLEHAGADGPVHELPAEIDAALVAQRVKRRIGPLSLATVRHRLAVLSEAHEARALANPCRDRAVQILMTRARNAYARRGVQPARKEALTREPFERLLATCDDSLIGLRDRALLLFAWASGGRRRSEVVRATFTNTTRTSDGWQFQLNHSKTNQGGQARADALKPVIGRAARALDAWVAAAGLTEGAIFRRVLKGGHVGGPLSAEAVRRIVQARCAQAGLEGDYAAHSLRSGFVTEAGRAGVPIADVMAMTGHASVTSVVGYHRAGAMAASRAARLLDDDGQATATPVEPGLDRSL